MPELRLTAHTPQVDKSLSDPLIPFNRGSTYNWGDRKQTSLSTPCHFSYEVSVGTSNLRPFWKDSFLELVISVMKRGTASHQRCCYLLNKLLTLDHHSTQCHWPHTLEWGCFVGPCMLICRRTKSVFSYPKLMLKNAYSIVLRATFIIYQHTLHLS